MQGQTIVCVATEAWDSLWRSTQQYMSRLAIQNRVLYFEPGRRPDRGVLAEFGRNWQSLFRLRYETVHDNLILVATPPRLPTGRQALPRAALRITAPLVQHANAGILIRRLRRAMVALGVRSPLLWICSPSDVGLVGRLGERLACYFNYDEFANFEQNVRIREFVRKQDDELTSRVDVVFATSSSQWQHRRRINPNTHFLPHGVDFELFNQALLPGFPLPTDIASVPRPIIGYAGWVGWQMDVELLCRVASVCSTCSLVLVGPDKLPRSDDERELRSLPNVFFLGRKDRSALPGYLRAFDVALIPYALRGFVPTAFPVKLLEYLAAGRAVVATAMPELQPYRDLVRIAETHDQFAQSVHEALDDRSPQAIAARVAVARDNTWDQRVAQIHGVLDQMLSTKSQRPVV